MNPKILFFDIETIKTMFSGRFGKLESENCAVLTFQYAWGEKGKVEIVHAGQFPSAFKKNVFDDRRVLAEAAKIILEADVIVAHFGSGFDKPLLRTRLILNGFHEAAAHLQRVKLIDTCTIARQLYRVRSSSLRYLAELLGLTQKKECGFEVWEAVRSGDLRALSKLVQYAKGDIVTLRELYLHERGLMHNHPKFNFDNKDACPTCNSIWVVKKAKPWLHGKFAYENCHCRKCGANFRGKKLNA